MTDNTSARAHDTADGTDADASDIDSYDDLLATLDVLEKEALRKIESGRVYDATNERVRIKWIRIAKDIIAEKRKVKTERDLEELADRVEALEADGEPRLTEVLRDE